MSFERTGKTGNSPESHLKPSAQERSEPPMDRGRASEIFASIADMGVSGHWPGDVTPELLAEAIRRLLPNNGLTDKENFTTLIAALQRRGK